MKNDEQNKEKRNEINRIKGETMNMLIIKCNAIPRDNIFLEKSSAVTCLVVLFNVGRLDERAQTNE